MTQIKTLKHVESISDLIQMGDAMEQDLDDAIRTRAEELMEKNGIDENDMVEYNTSVEVKIEIKYKKGNN